MNGCYKKNDMSKHIILRLSEFAPPFLLVIIPLKVWRSWKHACALRIRWGMGILIVMWKYRRPLVRSKIESYGWEAAKKQGLNIIMYWAKYWFLILFITYVDVKKKSRLDLCVRSLSILWTKFKEFRTTLNSLNVCK